MRLYPIFLPLALGLWMIGCTCDARNASNFGDPDLSQEGQAGAPCTSDFSCKTGNCDLTDTLTCIGSCIDNDDDRFGVGCRNGTDCNDEDPDQGNREDCSDGIDNDCDDNVDEGADPACGCSSDCDSVAHGKDGIPFDPENRGSPQIGSDDEGALQLETENGSRQGLIWIANTREGSISKIDIATFKELGRFQTGPLNMPLSNGTAQFFEGNDPSRTTADPDTGDIYIANRNHASVLMISSSGASCGPNTSTPSDLSRRPWVDGKPTDDCIKWHRKLQDLQPRETLIRAAALQKVRLLDGTTRRYLWIGGFATNSVWKLDADNGDVLLQFQSPTRPYGFALDDTGNLWIASRLCRREACDGEPETMRRALGRVNTNASDESLLNSSVCVTDTTATNEAGDSCDKQAIFVPKETNSRLEDLYGITVAKNQTVWLGGAYIRRYDPGADLDKRFSKERSIPAARGIAGDSKGFVYAARSEGGTSPRGDSIVQINSNAATWTAAEISQTTGFGDAGWGIAIDQLDQVWVIHVDRSFATVLKPTATLGVFDGKFYENNPSHPTNPDPDGDGIIQQAVDYLAGTYTYSDMTGQQLAFATQPSGTYNQVFEGCPTNDDTRWNRLLFDIETPAGTGVSFRARTASTLEAIGDAEWIAIGAASENENSLPLESILSMQGVAPKRYLELEVQLSTNNAESTPKIRYFEVSHSCPGGLE